LSSRQLRYSGVAACALAATGLLSSIGAAGQSQNVARGAALQGVVHDAQSRPLPSVIVHLRAGDGKPALTVQTDIHGAYHFTGIEAGTYSLRAEMAGYKEATFGPLALAQGESKVVDLTLEFAKASAPPGPEFFDQPQFTVAGVADTTNLGGHGSDTVVRNRETLTKEAVALGKESPPTSQPTSPPATDNSLREAAERNPGDFDANYRLGKFLADHGQAKDAIVYLERASRLKDQAELHHLLGEVDETVGDPLQAVHEYQRAAELSPNESNLFDWGSELLLHRAPEPAIEVFEKGNRLFPRSVRLLVGLGVAEYAHGATVEAIRRICQASDLNPNDSQPYLFLGRIQAAEKTGSDEITDKLRRFADLQPANALSNYYYALSLWKRRKSPQDVDLPKVESLLETAIRLDPGLGVAYLQLGILRAEQKDFPKAIAAYQKAIEVNPRLEEAHYRLAQAYRQTGEKLQAEKEIQLYEQLSRQTAGEVDRERHDIKQFVYTLRNPTPVPQPPVQ